MSWSTVGIMLFLVTNKWEYGYWFCSTNQ
jgi:hypothetical protein